MVRHKDKIMESFHINIKLVQEVVLSLNKLPNNKSIAAKNDPQLKNLHSKLASQDQAVVLDNDEMNEYHTKTTGESSLPTSDGQIVPYHRQSIRPVDFRKITGAMCSHVDDVVSVGNKKPFYQENGPWRSLDRIWGYGEEENARQGLTYAGKQHTLDDRRGHHISMKAKCLAVPEFKP